MRKLTLFLTIAFVLTCGSGLLAQDTHIGVISIDNITNTVPGDLTLLNAGKDHVMSIRYDFLGLTQKWSTANAYEVYSPDGADWVDLVATDGPFTNAITPLPPAGALRIHKYYTSSNNGVNYSGTVQVPYEQDPYGEDITNPTWFYQPGPNPGYGTPSADSCRVAYSLAMVDLSGGGYQAPLNGIALTLQFSTRGEIDNGKTMCVDSVNVSGTVAWGWDKPSGSDKPQWDGDPVTAGVQPGPHCWEIFFIPNQPPEWCVAADDVEFNHCLEGTYPLCATDPDQTVPDNEITYSFAPGFETGFGEIGGTGYDDNEWHWSGPTVPQSDMVNIDFIANDSESDAETYFQLHVTTTNIAPTLDCPTGIKTVGADKCDSVMFTAGDLDVCDLPLTITPSGTMDGTYDVRGSYVILCPTELDAGPVDIVLTASDGEVQLDATCTVHFNVIVGAPYQVELEKKEAQYQGIFTNVFIQLYGVDPEQGLGGFDFLVAYDASALAFQLAYGGQIYNQDDADLPGCGWEYFTYRFGPYGNCDNACPSGLLRVIGLAETNNGPNHPDCQTTQYYPADSEDFPITLAQLRFLVSNDRNLECQFVPIRFFWIECGDNALSSADGSLLMLSDAVYDFVDYGSAFIGTSVAGVAEFPTYLGAQEECICDAYDELSNPNGDPTCKIAAKRYVDFQNGGVDIACADSIDARGDINLNGLANEIADAVMFTNYFIQGVGAFGGHVEGSIAASDTNADGLALTVADLVYLIRVVIGDAAPYDKVIPAAAKVTFGDGIFNVDTEMGAAHVVMAGEVTPRLLATNMEMKYGVVNGNTNILVFSMEPNQSFSGKFLQVEGRMISSQFATFLGQPVNADVMPANFALHQNYPNPFNPTTTIKIEIPRAGVNWNLNIYNVTGQLVQTMSGKSTGYDEVVWDASNNASGIYFYKLTAGDYSATKKAVLLK